MAASPPIKVYRNGEYVASTKYFEDAAAIAGMTNGTVVKWEGRFVIWVEGKEDVNAADSCDAAARIMEARVDKLRNELRNKLAKNRQDCLNQ